MDVSRAKQIYDSSQTIGVQLDGKAVWIEHVDVANSMATVQVGSNPLNTETVSVERLREE
ncbi:small, acid-soluble spore protein, H family [Paenibacillus sp. BIHB 4019]|uniref:Small, acid-soluble spore protein, H family n=1 Tax=Paenibacillus sp. BIHB 4019 TaxID=1870819 RepID=A0A1B2DCC9_9BACL|nr:MULTISPECIES: H-type small acid-soluble spore protein [unclassified Paenibacillus]ANY65357.1 small, acid-soluble spore protein, H family [Paenibacillus sp. BIHB 4019]KQO15370.1 spore protein [Paenibacillus sp. Leaf72]